MEFSHLWCTSQVQVLSRAQMQPILPIPAALLVRIQTQQLCKCMKFRMCRWLEPGDEIVQLNLIPRWTGMQKENKQFQRRKIN